MIFWHFIFKNYIYNLKIQKVKKFFFRKLKNFSLMYMCESTVHISMACMQISEDNTKCWLSPSALFETCSLFVCLCTRLAGRQSSGVLLSLLPTLPQEHQDYRYILLGPILFIASLLWQVFIPGSFSSFLESFFLFVFVCLLFFKFLYVENN